ncbi:MAG: UvrD-helicase domain-containing protein [Gammaproteobacteria bacterium]
MILTNEQVEVINAASENIFIQACAGAGKTTVIVERFIRETQNNLSRTGIAALSFTNVAVDAIHDRCICLGQNYLMDFPNFIGTFDSFINRYIVLPFSRSKKTLIDSWENFYFEFKGRKIPLTFLIKENYSSYKLKIPESLKYKEIGKIVNDNMSGAIEAAIKKRNKLLEHGYLTSEDCREMASTLLTEHSSIAENISRRFREIIVDEAQDCNDTDLNILKCLRENGTHIVIMGDPNQNIFEFRKSMPINLEQFASANKKMLITGNWRSSKNICSFTANLKTGTNEPDNSLCMSDSNLPIYLLKYKTNLTKKIATRFLSICKVNVLCLAQCSILAYRKKDVFLSIGKAIPKITSSNLYLYFNWKYIFNNPVSSKKDRLSVLKSMEKFLVRHIVNQYNDDLPLEEFCEAHRINERWLRRVAFHILVNSPSLPNKSSQLKEWHQNTVEFFKTLSSHPGYKWKSFAVSFRFTKGITVKQDCALEGLKYSTIHKAKGEEFDAVLVVIPPTNVDKESLFGFIKKEEQKRVYYVGTTRAKKLLGLAVPENLFDSIEKILSDKSINYSIIEV